MKYSRKHYTLQRKFLLSLGISAVVLCVLFSAIFYVHMRSVVEEQVRDKAELVFAQIDAIQAYVRTVLRPRMFERHPDDFLIEAMSSSFISRNIMERVGDKAIGHVYRRVAEGARNPQSEASDLELSLIDHFRSDRTLDKWAGTVKMRGSDYYVIARPVIFGKECMPCHGMREDAPIELVHLYGERGFGHTLNSLSGLDFVAFPVGATESQLKGVITSYFILFALCALFFFATAFFVFRILVVRRLYGLATSFRRTLYDEKADILDRVQEKDEVEEVVECFEQVANHLVDARMQLQSYAENLRQMVDARTVELLHEANERQEDVALFVQLLENVRGTYSRDALWPAALPHICRRFHAERIAYICTFSSQRYYVWPETESLPELPNPLTPLFINGGVHVLGQRVFVPVEAQDGATEGLLCLEWSSVDEATRQNRDVLRALGRQLGTVAENISALDRVMRQMDLLQAVFDGVGDPLALLDDSGKLIIANEGARKLAQELSGTQDILPDFLEVLFADDAVPVRESALRGERESRTCMSATGRSFQVHLYPLPQVDDRPGRMAVYVRETTAERQMLARISQSERLASVGKLSAGLAHEINNPLGVILCYAELLRQGASAEQVADLDIIVRHTRQAQRVLRDLLNFARPKSYSGVPTNAEATVRRVVEVFMPQATHKGVELYFYHEGAIGEIGMSEQVLEQIVTNLLLNALDAVPEKEGRIEVALRANGTSGVILTVEDNGVGLSAEAQQRVFDPFYTTKDTGTGLGLAVVYGAVMDAGGMVDVTIASVLGGACFRLFLPSASVSKTEKHAEGSHEY